MTFLQDRYGVENVTYMQSSLATAGDEAGFGGLVISSTPGSDTLRGKFHNSTIPIVNWEEAIADNGAGEFRVTGGRPKDNVATDHVISIREEHPITAGFSVGQEVTISTGQTEVWWSTGQQAPGSVSLGNELEDATRLFLTIVDEGGELNNGTSAPGRRVMLGMTDNTFNNFTEDGRTLAGQAIDWALGITTSAEPIRVTDFTLDPITGNASITWTARPNKFYTVFYSDDLVDLQDGGDVADSLSDGDGTDLDPAEGSYRREFVNPLPASPARFFSVHEDEQ